MLFKDLLKLIIPPVIIQLANRISRKEQPHVEWEYIPEGWDYAKNHPEVKGWNVQAILDTYKAKWPKFLEMMEGAGPLGVSHESALTSNEDVSNHNTIMSFAYVLALAARGKKRISILDWGGGIGHYYVLSTSLLPDVEIEYHCNDLPLLTAYGAKLFPNQHFYTNDSCLERIYDLVFASASLHYTQDWPALLSKLAKAAQPYVYITRLPTVLEAQSFVFVQRPYAYGYHTEYLGWCLNRTNFLREAENIDLRLVREFVIGESPLIAGVPEPCRYRGFLFRSACQNGD